MKYKFFHQDEYNFCVPACLQSILYRRNFEVPTQKEIFNFLKTNDEGVVLNQENLNLFLEQYSLKSEYIHPRTSFPEIDFVLEESLKQQKDILSAFQYDPENKHAVLLIDIKFPDVFLQDPGKKINQINLTYLFSLMHLDWQSSFYLIS